MKLRGRVALRALPIAELTLRLTRERGPETALVVREHVPAANHLVASSAEPFSKGRVRKEG